MNNYDKFHEKEVQRIHEEFSIHELCQQSTELQVRLEDLYHEPSEKTWNHFLQGVDDYVSELAHQRMLDGE